MGIYINPGNEAFRVKRADRYVDKSGLIGAMNATIGRAKKFTCVSRPRRFGKSTAAQMLCAYYCTGVDSSALFDDLEIAKTPDYRIHLNQYNVLYLDMTGVKAEGGGGNNVAASATRLLQRELKSRYPDLHKDSGLGEMLLYAVEKSERKFIAIIDEWDAPIRDQTATAMTQLAYLEFLRGLFKNSQITDRVFAAAFMTGILPIKKDGSQSAVSEFREYTMLKPGGFAPYIGFLENEVRQLCDKYGGDYEEMKRWYDGYVLGEAGSVYNSNSVMMALEERDYRSYWQMSSAARSLLSYVNLDYDGLGEAVPELLAGNRVSVRVSQFQNDVSDLHSADDVLTLLIHFGYLSYDAESETACIPNEEVRQEYADMIRNVKHIHTIQRVRESEQLLQDTIDMNSLEVASQIERIHQEECTPLHYNNEQSLRSVIKLAYFIYKDYYTQLEELPGGLGYADIVYLPKKYSEKPILVVELKWNDRAEGAIAQIKKQKYPSQLLNRDEDILLIGISYNKEDKKHNCVIEKMRGT